MRRNLVSALTLAAVMTGAYGAHGATASADFYQGKVMRIIVGFSAGGGFDTFARTVARYMGKYIPGNPSIVVDNMPGAGSLIAANHIYRVAKPDGLTIGAFNGNQILGQLVGAQGTNFDARKMQWMGAPGYNHDLCVLHQRTGITSAEQWMAAKTPLKLAGSAPGSTTDDVAKVLKEAIGLPMRLVTGYKGTADMRIAVESGEMDGLCGFSWVSVKSTWRRAVESGQAIIMLQSAPKAHADLPKVPLTISFAKTRRGAPIDRSRRAPTRCDHLRLLTAAEHTAGARAIAAQGIYPSYKRSRSIERREQSQSGNRPGVR